MAVINALNGGSIGVQILGSGILTYFNGGIRRNMARLRHNLNLIVRVALGDSNQVRISASENVYKDLQWYDTTSLVKCGYGRIELVAMVINFRAWYNNGSSWNTQAAITLDTNNNIGVNGDIYGQF